LAHQLSQPLTAIGLQTETLKRGLNNSGGNQVYVLMLDKINSQLRKLTNLVKNLRQLFNSNIHDFHRIDLAFTINELLEIIDIEDTGSGIDIKMLPVMFELYKTSKKDGLGIGLWLYKTIINKHHGEISASNGQNSGARFTIQLPIARTPS